MVRDDYIFGYHLNSIDMTIFLGVLEVDQGEKNIKMLFINIHFSSGELIFLISKSETVVGTRLACLYVNMTVYSFFLY